MAEKICIYEDDGFKNLLPLTYLQPVYELRCGILTLREKIQKHFPSLEPIFSSRKELSHLLRERFPENNVNDLDADSILFINGRVLLNSEAFEKIKKEKEDILFISGDDIAAAVLSRGNIDKLNPGDEKYLINFNSIDAKKIEIEVEFIQYPWDLIRLNSDEIQNDINLLATGEEKVKENFSGVYFINDSEIRIGSNVTIKPNVILDAETGPIYIDDDVTILPNVYIQGPAYIGRKSLIKANTQIYEGTTIGPVCKAGGEIENSIIHSFSNKQHEGFLGHSYLGSWVNIGASSNTSDLKNNYGTIKVNINGEEIDTGLQFVGSILADHTKCGINTMFNTGTIAGVSCNIYGSGFPPKYIPSFSWGGPQGFTEYDLRKAAEVAKIVKSRRNVSMSLNDLELFKSVFEKTKLERKNILEK